MLMHSESRGSHRKPCGEQQNRDQPCVLHRQCVASLHSTDAEPVNALLCWIPANTDCIPPAVAGAWYQRHLPIWSLSQKCWLGILPSQLAYSNASAAEVLCS